jgi:hypothetical protein
MSYANNISFITGHEAVVAKEQKVPPVVVRGQFHGDVGPSFDVDNPRGAS